MKETIESDFGFESEFDFEFGVASRLLADSCFR